jgi:hypothetical protein
MGLTVVDVVESLLDGSIIFKFRPRIWVTFSAFDHGAYENIKGSLFHFDRIASFARNCSFSGVPGWLLRRAASNNFQLTWCRRFSGKSSLEMRSRLLEPRLSFNPF